MFPPMTSSLSLDAYLMRFSRNNSLWSLKKRRPSPKVRELRKYRSIIKRFLTSLMADVLRERLRQAAETDGKTITAFLQDHQWAILKAIGNNQLIIDLIYPRVSETVILKNWGPLLTCAVLKATKCLSKEETADIISIDKVCRKYITKYKCTRHKGLKTVKQDWNTICLCAQKMADFAKNAKLIKSVRNFIIETSLPPMINLSRPCSAPARLLLKRKLEQERQSFTRRPATATLPRDKLSTKHIRDGQFRIDFSPQRQNNYCAPKTITIPVASSEESHETKGKLNEKTKHDNDDLKNICTNNEIAPKGRKSTNKTGLKVKRMQKVESENKINTEQRLRKLSGRVLTPVPIPKTIADLKAKKRPFRLIPLYSRFAKIPAIVDSRRVQSAGAERGTHSELLTSLPLPSIGESREISPRLKSASSPHPSTSLTIVREKSESSSNPSSPKQDFTNKQIKQLVSESIKHKNVEKVAASGLFRDKVFIDKFFDYLEETNKMVKFLHTRNAEAHKTWESADGNKVHFSFLHYSIFRKFEENDTEDTWLIYLVQKLLHGLTCDHDVSDDVSLKCWKCSQKKLAMEISVIFGNLKVSELLLKEGVPFTEEHLIAALKTKELDMFKQVIAFLKDNENWNSEGATVKRVYDLAYSQKMNPFVSLLQAEGVFQPEAGHDEKEVTRLSCLPCFMKMKS